VKERDTKTYLGKVDVGPLNIETELVARNVGEPIREQDGSKNNNIDENNESSRRGCPELQGSDDLRQDVHPSETSWTKTFWRDLPHKGRSPVTCKSLARLVSFFSFLAHGSKKKLIWDLR
jgi:hypothetical protein